MKGAIIIRNIVAGIIVMLVSLVYPFLGEFSVSDLGLFTIIIYGIAATVLLSFSEKYVNNDNRGAHVLSAVLAFLFSQFITIGQSIHFAHNWSLCFGNMVNVCLWIVQSLCYGWVLYRILFGVIGFIDQKTSTCCNESRINLYLLFGILVSVRLVFLAAFYPCAFGFDAAVGLHTLLDPESAICDHHPFYVQLLHGFFFLLGKTLGGTSRGMALLTLLFIFFSSGIIVYGIKLLEKAHVRAKWVKAIACIYAILPIFPYMSVYPTKDGIFAYVFLLYTLTIFEICVTQASCAKKARFVLLHGIAIILICITRHQGIYIVLLELFLLLILLCKKKMSITIASVPAIIIALILLKVVMPICNVEPGGKQELYGTLFQQTAYYLQKHPEDVTLEETQTINSILNADTIAAKYTYDITDIVKNGYKYNPWYRVAPDTPSMFRHVDHTGEDEALKAYRSVWFAMFMRHPLTCIEASVCVCSGFFYNNNRPILTIEPWWAENKNATTPNYVFAHVTRVADLYNKNVKKLLDKPVLSWVLTIPYYIWLSIFLLSFLLYRRDWNGIGIFFPTILSLGILLICPVAFGRYTFPILIVLPLLLAYVFNYEKKNEICQR